MTPERTEYVQIAQKYGGHILSEENSLKDPDSGAQISTGLTFSEQMFRGHLCQKYSLYSKFIPQYIRANENP